MARTARAAIGVLLFGLAGATLPPQTRDMTEALRDHGAFGFQFALAIFGLSAWFWSRAALAARFGIPDTDAARGASLGRAHPPSDIPLKTPYTYLPRLLFGAAALGGQAVAAPHSSLLANFGFVLWWGAGHIVLSKRPRLGNSGAVPPKLVVSHGVIEWFRHLFPNLRALIWYAPFPNIVAYSLLIVSFAPFLLGAVDSYVPESWRWYPDFVSLFASLFPGPAIAVLLLGLMIGPLTVLTFAFDGWYFRIDIERFDLGLKRPPVLAAFAILVLVLLPGWFPIHTVRVVLPAPSHEASATTSKCAQPCPHSVASMRPEDRLGLSEFAGMWPDGPCPGGRKRPIIVAISGGGMKAAVWGARILYEIENLAGPDGPELRAISSVSGGSLGAAMTLSLLAGYQHRVGAPSCHEPRATNRAMKMGLEVLASPGPFSNDSLGPLLAGWLMADLPRTILSPVAALVRLNRWRPSGGDRAEAIEKSFEAAWRPAARHAAAPGLDGPLLDLFYTLDESQPGTPSWQWRPGMPLWLANGTNAGTGNRYITTAIQPFAHKGRDADWPFSGASDVLSLLGADVRVSTATNNTARFPFLEPFGEVLPVDKTDGMNQRVHEGELVDGGYFENEGLQTALDLANAMTPPDNSVKPIIVVATADGENGTKKSDIVRCGNDLVPEPNEAPERDDGNVWQILAPVVGLNNVRGGHSLALLHEAAHAYCPSDRDPNDRDHEKRFFHFYLPGIDDADVPLNWILSRATVKAIWDQMKNPDVGNNQEYADLARALRAN